MENATRFRRFSVKSIFYFSGFLGFLLLFQNCSPSSNNSQSGPAASPFAQPSAYFRSAPKVVVEVHYETGAEPFIGTTASGRNYWSILEDNLIAIFAYRSAPPTLAVPKTLAEMYALPAQNKSSWTITEIDALSQAHRVASSSSGESRFHVYFLNGYFQDEAGTQTTVIGLNVSGTPTIAIFKQVINSSGASPSGPVPKFVEQSTMIHEIGHALGFVNNGVPMVSNHEDTPHGAHTTNSTCVMYYLNEGAADLVQFVQRFTTSSSVVMWGPEVLQDAQSFSR